MQGGRLKLLRRTGDKGSHRRVWGSLQVTRKREIFKQNAVILGQPVMATPLTP
jgi:hypothetical protein